ncbi:hypothetical protein CN230_31305, partial [Sinorhizobium meliloti]
MKAEFKCRTITTATLAIFAALTLPAHAQEGAATPKNMNEAEVIGEVQTIKQSDLIKLSKPLVVDGDMLFDGWFIVSDQIIFKPGSRLTFSRQAQEKRLNFFIVAKEIRNEDQNNPGLITYEQPQTGTAPPTAGQAPSGAAGPGDGDHGRQGQPGEKGIKGAKGNTAPSLTITVLNVPGPGAMIDFKGGQGGKGGQGQKGGDGGRGHQGSPASQ